MRWWPTFVLGALLPSLAGAEDGDWVLESRRGGVLVYSRHQGTSDFLEFKAVAQLPAPLFQIAAVLTDPASYSEWIPRCISARVLQSERGPSHEQVFYARYYGKVLGIGSDRDLVARLWTYRLKDSLHVDYTVETDYAHGIVEDVIRIEESRTQWTLETGSRGTQVTLISSTDPGGFLPAWLVNWVSKDMPAELVHGLERQSRLERYRKRAAHLSEMIMAAPPR